MSGADRAFRALGIALVGSVLSWLVTFGIAFLVDDAHHHLASIGIGGVHSQGQGLWIVAPIVGSLASVVIGLLTSFDI